MVEVEGEQFSLRWNNFHSNLSAGFHALLEGEDLVDVTLAAGGQFVQAHKIVLSVCSPYFKELFKVNPCKHPIVILKDVCHKELVAILQFMYQGEVNVRQEELAAFLKTAEMLQIKGLTGDDSPATNTSIPIPVPASERTPQSRTQPQPQPVLEPLVIQSEEPPTRAYKRMRTSESQPPPSTTSVASPPCTVNEDTSGVEFMEMTKPKVEPVDYESDIEEVDRKLPSQEDSLVQLLGGESSSQSHQDATQGNVSGSYSVEQHLKLQIVPKRAPVKDPLFRLDGPLSRHVLVRLPPTRNDRTPTRNCRVCIRSKKRSETRYICIVCGVPMHKENCFLRYHTLLKY
ncbi:modifier of mdg4-like isoform X14 [Periplaneta americana]|uniref:modifier of mdg4-like isoform X14 n=1 Tax=Periplaneta americana TaxID=6978 RepID=UPI0037E81C62